MFDQIHTILDEVNEFESTDLKEIEAFRISYLGKKGKITSLFQSFRDVPVEHKKEFGQKLNMLKNTAAEKVNTLKQNANKGEKSQNNIDYSLTPQPTNLGSRHPGVPPPGRIKVLVLVPIASSALRKSFKLKSNPR